MSYAICGRRWMRGGIVFDGFIPDICHRRHGLNIDCIQNSNIIRITYYSYSYWGPILNPNIIRIRIRPNICARILLVFVFAQSEKSEYYSSTYSVKILIPNNIRIRIRSKKQYSLTSGTIMYQLVSLYNSPSSNAHLSQLMISLDMHSIVYGLFCLSKVEPSCDSDELAPSFSIAFSVVSLSSII